MWRVYQRGLERWIADLLQPVFDNLVTDGMVPRFVQASALAYHASFSASPSCKLPSPTHVINTSWFGDRFLQCMEHFSTCTGRQWQ